jgi:ribonucleotide reductase beta subunit family protein with ferritin-like domain
MTRITEKTASFVEHYPEFREMAEAQLKVLWFSDEIKLEKDIQDILVNMTEAEKHGVTTILRLFTIYERFAGVEFWAGKMMKRYPRPEIQAMAATFSAFELAVHQPFYSKINELLNLNTDEFYLSYADDPMLKEKIDFIDTLVAGKVGSESKEMDELISTGAFTFVEGGVLYASFAFLKHFQSQGKNLVLNLVRGINFSAVDENLHSVGAAACFQVHKEEMKLSTTQEDYVQNKLKEVAMTIFEHECRIIDMIFEKGPIEGITDVQLKHFVESRINQCLKNLGYTNLFKVPYNPIGEWFYKGLNNYQFVDFFTGQGREYQRNWNKQGFAWKGVKS